MRTKSIFVEKSCFITTKQWVNPKI